MKRMWIRLKDECDARTLEQELGGIGRVELDPSDPCQLTLTFHNHSESGMRMAGFRLSQDFIHYFQDFGMVA